MVTYEINPIFLMSARIETSFDSLTSERKYIAGATINPANDVRNGQHDVRNGQHDDRTGKLTQRRETTTTTTKNQVGAICQTSM